MPNLPVRGLSSTGIVTDLNPHDLPITGFSDGANVMFRDGAVIRSPVFKDLATITATTALSDTQEDGFKGVFTYNTPTSGAIIGVASDINTVFEYDSGSEANHTPAGAVMTQSNGIWTSSEVAGFVILNRNTSEPYIKDGVSSATFHKMSDGDWPVADRANSMRTFKDFILALNIVESGINKGTTIKWTDAIQFRSGYTNVTWAQTVTNSAGANVLSDFDTNIVDGLALGNMFIIYSTTESAIMEFTGSNSVFSFRSFYQGDGVINVNCVASTGKEHYVFGDTDIYMHNGITIKTLGRGRVKDKVYSELIRDNQDKCFVHHDEVNQLVYFCYPSAETNVGFTLTEYCNRAAVYDLKSQTFSFVDLPNCVGAGYANISLTSTGYNVITTSYAANANKYSQYEDSSPRVSVFVSAEDQANGLLESRVFANDMLVTGLLATSSNSEALKTAFVERIGLDVDETQAPLRSYKQFKSMVPQITTLGGTDDLTVSIGATDLPYDTTPAYSTVFNFEPDTHHKIDSKASGRLLAYKVEEINGNFFDFSAADFDIEITSAR